MVYNRPQGTYKFTPAPLDGIRTTKSVIPSADRYSFTGRSSVFDERYEWPGHGYRDVISKKEANLPVAYDWYNIKDVFSSKVHESISEIIRLNAEVGTYNPYPYGDISLSIIEQSLADDLKISLEKIETLDGNSAKRNFLATIQNLLVRNELKYFNSNYIKRLGNTHAFNNAPKYATNNLIKDENIAYKIAKEDSADLDYTKYSGVLSDRLKYWRTIPADVNKKLVVLKEDGTEHSFTIATDDTLHVEDSGKTVNKVPYEAGDHILVNSSIVKLTSDISKAKVPTLIDSEKIFNLLREDSSITIKVATTETDNIETTYTTATGRDSYIVLNLDTTSVSDLESNTSLIRSTTATYNTTTTIDTDLERKAFPNAVFYVLHDDPIIDYLIDKEQATVTFSDFSTHFFNNIDEKTYPRCIPQHIVIVPTDKTEYTPFHGRSKMGVYGTRSLKFIPHLDNDVQDSGVNCSHLTHNATTNTYTFNTAAFPNSTYYKKGSETLPRTPGPLYKALTVMKSLNTSYGTLPSVTPFVELFYRLTPSQLHSLRLDVENYKTFLSKLRLQTLSSSTSVSETFPKMGHISRDKYTTLLTYVGATETYPKLSVYKNLINKSHAPIYLEGYPYE